MGRVIISGGGTGGHVFPAIAIADALKKQDPATEILFVGAEGRMEMERVPKAGYKIEGLPIAGFQRNLTWKNLSFPFKLLKSMRRAKTIVKAFRPDIAVGVGGYASGPVLRASNIAGHQTLIQEQNSYPGITNRILSKNASAICVAYPGMERYFPADKIILTGNPVRQDIAGQENRRAEALEYFNLDRNKKTIVVMGGSLGARTLNEAMTSGYDLIQAHPQIQWIWQCGSYYKEQYKDHPLAAASNIRYMPFIDRVDLAYACSDLLICRAGALTISEICVAGKASILIPSPNVAEDHQTKNARALSDIHAAEMISDAQAQELLIPRAIQLVNEEGALAQLAENARQLGKPHAARDIAKIIIKLVDRHSISLTPTE